MHRPHNQPYPSFIHFCIQYLSEGWGNIHNIYITNIFLNSGLSNKRQTVSSQYCPYCPVCSYVFFDHKQLKKHTSQQHREANIARWQCNLCALRYRSSAKLNVHLLAHHMHLKPYACQTCGKEFSDASNLRMHKSLHIGKRKLPIENGFTFLFIFFFFIFTSLNCLRDACLTLLEI